MQWPNELPSRVVTGRSPVCLDTENAPKLAAEAAAIQPGCSPRSGRINAGGSFEEE